MWHVVPPGRFTPVLQGERSSAGGKFVKLS